MPKSTFCSPGLGLFFDKLGQSAPIQLLEIQYPGFFVSILIINNTFLTNLKSTLKFLQGYTKHLLSNLESILKFLQSYMPETGPLSLSLRNLFMNLPQNQTITTKYLRKSLYQLTTQDYGNSSQY